MYSMERGESLAMEKELRNQWVFFWNSLKKEETVRSATQEKVVLQLATCKIPISPEKNLVAPVAYKRPHQISRAVGGNIVSHLNQSIYQQVEEMGIKYAIQGTGDSLKGASAGIAGHVDRKNELAERDGACFTVADLVWRQIDLNLWYNFYSIQEKARVGVRREKIGEDYKNKLAECKKVAMLYGNLSKKTLVRAMRRAKKEGGDLDSQFLSSLERRLDVALNRALFFSTIKSARQWVFCGRILVNNQPCTTPSYLLQPGDLLTISPPARTIWRKQFFQFFGATLDSNTISREGGAMELQGDWLGGRDRVGNGGTLFEKKRVATERRYPFSPPLMQKWQRWSKLWGNSPQSSGGHVFQRLVDNSELQFPHFSRSSFFFSALKSTQLDGHRRKTRITHWLGVSQERRRRSFFLPPAASWLHQQQPHVVDGLFPPRWNRVFAKSKSIGQREHDWRWSCIKPLHLECSYKHYTAIFLYAPQKLAWPCSINVNLLRKALN